MTTTARRYDTAVRRLSAAREEKKLAGVNVTAKHQQDVDRATDEMCARHAEHHAEWQAAMQTAPVVAITRYSPGTISVCRAHPAGDGGRSVFYHPGDAGWEVVSKLADRVAVLRRVDPNGRRSTAALVAASVAELTAGPWTH